MDIDARTCEDRLRHQVAAEGQGRFNVVKFRLKVRPEQIELLDRASSILGISRSSLILQSACTRAVEVLIQGEVSQQMIDEIYAQYAQMHTSQHRAAVEALFTSTSDDMGNAAVLGAASKDDRRLRVRPVVVLLGKATEVLGSRAYALSWMTSAKKSLGNVMPVEAAQTPEGLLLALEILGRIEHGMYA